MAAADSGDTGQVRMRTQREAQGRIRTQRGSGEDEDTVQKWAQLRMKHQEWPPLLFLSHLHKPSLLLTLFFDYIHDLQLLLLT